MKWQLGEDYKVLNREIEELYDELRHYWTKLKFPTQQLSEIKNRDFVDGLGDGVANAIDMENELNGKIESLKELRLAVEERIESLPSEHRRLMRLRYIRGFTWQQIAIRIYCDESTCRRIHRKILRTI